MTDGSAGREGLNFQGWGGSGEQKYPGWGWRDRKKTAPWLGQAAGLSQWWGCTPDVYRQHLVDQANHA